MYPNSTFFRFLLVGIVNTIIGLSLMLALLNWAGIGYWLSTCIGNAAGACVSYVLNRTYTFRSDVLWWKGFVLFVLVVLGCYVISYGLGIALIERALPVIFPKASPKIIENTAIVAGMSMYTIINYFFQKKLVFASSLLKKADDYR